MTPSEHPTLPSGDKTWFVKVEGGKVEWGMVRPFDDGSAVLRTTREYRTCAPPNGPREAVELLRTEGFVQLEKARARGLVAESDEPPGW